MIVRSAILPRKYFIRPTGVILPHKGIVVPGHLGIGAREITVRISENYYGTFFINDYARYHIGARCAKLLRPDLIAAAVELTDKCVPASGASANTWSTARHCAVDVTRGDN
jgi:hypothetical protein